MTLDLKAAFLVADHGIAGLPYVGWPLHCKVRVASCVYMEVGGARIDVGGC